MGINYRVSELHVSNDNKICICCGKKAKYKAYNLYYCAKHFKAKGYKKPIYAYKYQYTYTVDDITHKISRKKYKDESDFLCNGKNEGIPTGYVTDIVRVAGSREEFRIG